MDGDYKYRPRFIDIRIKPPRDEAGPREHVCEYPGCRAKATARSPKNPGLPGEYYQFCAAHAAEYNKAWNYFEGMSEDEARAHVRADQYGHRPTWSFSAGSSTRRKAERAAKSFQDGFFDPFTLFGNRPPPGAEKARARADTPEPGLGRLHQRALETLRLERTASRGEVRKRYAELVRAYHPDSNGGDRSMEEQLQKVVASYQILKNAGMA